MNGFELPVWIAAGSASIAFLAKAALWGKEFANGRKKNNNDGFSHDDRECLHDVRKESEDQTAVLRQIERNTFDLLAYFRPGMTR